MTERRERLSLSPEIVRLRELLREIGSDDEEMRETAEAEVLGVVRVVQALARCIALEQTLRAGSHDEGATLEAALRRALAVATEGEDA